MLWIYWIGHQKISKCPVKIKNYRMVTKNYRMVIQLVIKCTNNLKEKRGTVMCRLTLLRVPTLMLI